MMGPGMIQQHPYPNELYMHESHELYNYNLAKVSIASYLVS